MKEQQVLVWDIPTRLCHWLMVVGIFYAWFSVEIMEDMEQHFWAGYCVLTLLLFRIIWGFIGSHYARFNHFLYPISEVISYAKSLPREAKKRYLGHNPIGSLSALVMLAVIGVQAVTGLFNSDDYYFGPLYSLVSDDVAIKLSEVHNLNFDIVTGLVIVHILAIVFYRVFKKEKLTTAMITGKKPVIAGDEQAITSSQLWLALVVLALCAAAVYGLVNVFSDTAAIDEYNYSY